MASSTSRKRETSPGHVPLPLIDTTLRLWQEGAAQHWFVTAGSSMNPLIYDKDRVLVNHDLQHLQCGDIVVFRRAGHIVAHRVIRISLHATGQTLTTKGDNVLRFDEPVEIQNIIGKVIAVQRDGRHFQLDTSLWRMIGWLIATVSGAAATAYTCARLVKNHIVGPLPVRLGGRLKRFASAVLICLIRLAQLSRLKQ